MELFESDDPKTQLLKRSALHIEAIEEDAKLISAKTEKIIINALIIGGALAATYFLISQFSGGGKKKKHRKSKKIKVIAAQPSEEVVTVSEPETPGIMTQLGTALASQATVFLLDLAKEKLTEYLQSKSLKSNNNERS